jgi:hypothetical protein
VPGSLNIAFPATVFPKSLFTSFTEIQAYPILLNPGYHDSTQERSVITDGVNQPRPLRQWKLAQRLNVQDLAVYLNFFENAEIGGLFPFYFYPQCDVNPGQPFGSNWDSTGASVVGRATGYLRGNLKYVLTVGERSDVPEILIVEVA